MNACSSHLVFLFELSVPEDWIVWFLAFSPSPFFALCAPVCPRLLCRSSLSHFLSTTRDAGVSIVPAITHRAPTIPHTMPSFHICCCPVVHSCSLLVSVLVVNRCKAHLLFYMGDAHGGQSAAFCVHYKGAG